MSVPGAYRVVTEHNEPAILYATIGLAWCPWATPQCERCLDWQQILGPEEGPDVLPCPECLDKDTPEWDAERDGPKVRP